MTQSSASHRGDRTKNLVGFHVGTVHYAADISRVREILNPLPLIELPHAPPSIVGVVDHRGAVVPILDLRRRFGLPAVAPTRRTKWVVVALGRQPVGLVVDAVTDVFGAAQPDQRALPALGAGDEARGIAAVYKYDGLLTFVLDIDRVASPAQTIDLDSVHALIVEDTR
jgi:purine-binding chemotaxis protein CheW